LRSCNPIPISLAKHGRDTGRVPRSPAATDSDSLVHLVPAEHPHIDMSRGLVSGHILIVEVRLKDYMLIRTRMKGKIQKRLTVVSQNITDEIVAVIEGLNIYSITPSLSAFIAIRIVHAADRDIIWRSKPTGAGSQRGKMVPPTRNVEYIP